jgi:hypothetical protein
MAEMDVLTGDRLMSHRFLDEAKWDLNVAKGRFVDHLLSPPPEPREVDRLVLTMSEKTGDDEVSRSYLRKANFDYDDAVKLFMADHAGERGTSRRNPEETRKLRALMCLVKSERLAREFLVQANWDERAATRLVVQYLDRIRSSARK